MIGWHGQQFKEFSRDYQCFTHYASIEYLDYMHTMMTSAPTMGWRSWEGEEESKPETGKAEPVKITQQQIEAIKAMMGGHMPLKMEAALNQMKEGKMPEGVPPDMLQMIKSMTGGH